MAVNFYRMQVQPNVTGNLQDSISRGVCVPMPKGRRPDLGLRELLGKITPDLATLDVRHDLGYIWNFGLIGQNKNLRKRVLIN